ncbi:hypothetical protein BXZ70DRAFT_306364 [Cristinia sonorae]|uniref:F-box domain-containing protein n=1 Tax=Cristinia sonorae TaxID=1940300 RepID=A0A8K0UN16_9AGAR|nr:hypothetical protein BXZ70DRAFT_306364 [Cristinia sonorae]
MRQPCKMPSSVGGGDWVARLSYAPSCEQQLSLLPDCGLDSDPDMSETSTMSESLHSKPNHLPIEVWETIIDHLFDGISPASSQKDLYACCLVCRSWLPRGRYYLYTNVTIRSSSSLEGVVHCLSNAPWLSARITELTLECYPSDPTNRSWVSLAPFRLPKLNSLRELTISGFDFSQRYPNFYQAYRQLPALHLNVSDVECARYSQLTQLAVAVRANNLFVNAQLRWQRSPTLGWGLRPGPLLLGDARFTTFVMSWKEFCIASEHWAVKRSMLDFVRFQISGRTQAVEESDKGIGRDVTVWTRVARLFQDFCKILSEIGGVGGSTRLAVSILTRQPKLLIRHGGFTLSSVHGERLLSPNEK